ncbi:hypothetical protein SAMN06295945_1725 [Polynucleobacter meluiroseus]|jgi:hypothetical protein|uniref:Uncharacterized protein n=1 Tax=Polynucleobacter meluiroseus TaxID=1938814 RepID=A0A240E349_9BURK|nr:hypothetical protein [Polynucleobacter meluiroseus]SNX29354.1 hypothetical protein SAMN06295945_1725 [Polynucleobacter meluiroseus]
MSTPLKTQKQPDNEHFLQAIGHVDEAVQSGDIAVGAAKGIVYSVIETLGSMIGDPDLPAHVRSGYEGTLDLAKELLIKINLLD